MATIRRYESETVAQAVGTPGIDQSGAMIAQGIGAAASGLLDRAKTVEAERLKQEKARLDELKRIEAENQRIKDAASFARTSMDVYNFHSEAVTTSGSVEEYQKKMGEGITAIEKYTELTPAVRENLLSYSRSLTLQGSAETAAALSKKAAEKAQADVDYTLATMGQVAARQNDMGRITAVFDPKVSPSAAAVLTTLGEVQGRKALTKGRDTAIEASLTRQMGLDSNPYAVKGLLDNGTLFPKDFPEEKRNELRKANTNAIENYVLRVGMNAAAARADLTAVITRNNAIGRNDESLRLLAVERERATAAREAARQRGDTPAMAAADATLAAVTALYRQTQSFSTISADKPETIEEINQELSKVRNLKGKVDKRAELEAYTNMLSFLEDKVTAGLITPDRYASYLKMLQVPAAQSAEARASTTKGFLWGLTEYGESPAGRGSDEMTRVLAFLTPSSSKVVRGTARLGYEMELDKYREAHGGAEPTEAEAIAMANRAALRYFNIPVDSKQTYNLMGKEFHVEGGRIVPGRGR